MANVKEKPAKTRREPAQERSRRTVEQILAAAQELVDEGGVEAASTRAIAERAGVSAPSLYRFFADRDEVIDALMERLLAGLEAASRDAESGWAPETIEDLIRLELELTAEHFAAQPTLATLWFGGRGSPSVVAAVRARNHDLALRMRTMTAEHDLLDGEVSTAGFDLLVELGDRVLQVAFRGGAEPDREVLELGRTALAASVGAWSSQPA